MDATEVNVRSEGILLQGAQILEENLQAYGFVFEIVKHGSGSGGDFVVGRFVNGDRELRLGFRYQLGKVSYRKGEIERTHAEYMQALGRERDAAYPGYGGGDDLKGFHHLLSDLQYCETFLAENGDRFVALMREFTYQPPKPLWRS